MSRSITQAQIVVPLPGLPRWCLAGKKRLVKFIDTKNQAIPIPKTFSACRIHNSVLGGFGPFGHAYGGGGILEVERPHGFGLKVQLEGSCLRRKQAVSV